MSFRAFDQVVGTVLMGGAARASDFRIGNDSVSPTDFVPQLRNLPALAFGLRKESGTGRTVITA